ncbi:hypothetical protein ACFPYJ_11280 [Paenibacillus solisilvae]|uniref:Uncharacterized protein n=1 Tax=Paenibacillus solisilvae TaxID=2486751 RepID=A0ABW0VV03_9BACL
MQSYLKDGKTDYWNSWMQAQPGGSLSIMYQYSVDNRYLFDEFNGAPTPTMAQKQTTLDAMEQETFTKIIMNQASIDEFDKFVTSWKALGGDAITSEVNGG